MPDLLSNVIAAYGLKKTRPYESSIVGEWWEGYTGLRRLAVQPQAERLAVYLGDVVEVTEIYLVRQSATQPLPPDGSPERLDRIAGSTSSGAELARQFFLGAHPPGTFDYPQLRAPAVVTALSRLSPAVTEVMVCENFRGLELRVESRSSRESFDRDVAAGVDLLKALESWGPATGPR